MAEKVEIRFVIEANTGKVTVLDGKLGKLNASLKKTQKSAAGTTGAFSDLQSTVGSLLAGAAVANFFREAVQEASALQEVQSKFETVFRQNVEQAEEFASNLVKNFNLSERAAKEYLASIQDTLVPMGLMRQEAADLSNDIIKLAADLGSFNDVPVATVARDIQSALVGNTETIKKYGVVLKATDISQRAMADSGKSSADSLTNAEKVVAAYKLILEGTADAQGDVARTQDSFANRSRRLEARIKDLKAAIGGQLIPILSDLIGTTEGGFSVLSKAAALITATVATAITGLVTVGSAATTWIEFVIDSFVTSFGIARALMTGNAEEASRLIRKLREDAGKNLDNFVDSARNSSKSLSDTWTLAFDTVLDRQRETNKKIIQDDEDANDKKKGLTTEERNHRVAVLQEALANRQAMLQNELLDDELLTEERIAAITQAESDSVAIVQTGLAQKILSEDKAALQITKIRNKAAVARTKIDIKSQDEQKKNLTSTLNFITSLSSSKNKELAAIGKAAALASAFRDTFAAANKALASAPPPANFILAGLVTTAGLANVAKIATGTGFRKGGRPGGARRRFHGGRPQGSEQFLINDAVDGELETVVPDGKADLFADGVIAERNRQGRTGAGAGRGGGGSPVNVFVVFNEGAVQNTINGADFLGEPDAVERLAEALTLFMRNNPSSDIAAALASVLGESAQENDDRSFS